MKKRLLNAMAIVMALGMVFVAGSAWAGATTDTGDAVTFTLDNPTYITVTNATDSGEVDMDANAFTASKVAHCSWVVNSNNGFDINFTGSSVSDTNSAHSYPLYTKADYDASGGVVTDNYDHLATTFGIVINGEESVETTDSWGGGTVADTGDKSLLVGALQATGSPDSLMGTIMPSDAAGTATVDLYAKGVASQDTQSGVYTATATMTVTIDQQGDTD